MDPSTSTHKSLNTKLLNRILTGSMFHGSLVYRERIESTNSYARGLCETGAREGTVVVAEYQSAGRGRMGRKWFAEPGASLLFSVVLRPQMGMDSLFLVNCVASVAIVKGLWEECWIEAGIKWPNDIYVRDKKLGGLLGEFSVVSGRLEYVIIGIGLNVHWAPEEMGPGSACATSILLETGKGVCRTRLLGTILIHLQQTYQLLISGEEDRILQLYKKYSMVLGRDVRIGDENKILEAKALDIKADGTLVVEARGVGTKFIRWGDVSLRI